MKDTKDAEDTELFFIYGTLKRGMRNNCIMKDASAEFISKVKTSKKYSMFDLGHGFPYLQDNPRSVIHGELWKVRKSEIKKLDYFEGVPELYKKGKISVELESTVWDDVNTYFITDELTQEEINSLDDFQKFNEYME